MTRKGRQQRKRSCEIEAWVKIKGVVFPMTLYGNIIVEIEEVRYSTNTVLLKIKSPSKADFEQALIRMREFGSEVEE